MSGRDTPHSIQDGQFGFEPEGPIGFGMDADAPDELDTSTAQRLAREIYSTSTDWLNASRRAAWNDSLRAFQSLHPSGSKYLSGEYRFRSRLFRPKTRAMVRRDEASTAQSFFSNEDVVSVSAEDDDDPHQQASAEILKELLQYRLTKTIPWFLTLVGARQDAEVMGVCIAKAGWDYEEKFVRTELRPKMGDDGHPEYDDKKEQVATQRVNLFEVAKDEPYIDLLAPENFRFDPGCDWRDPVKKSPYLIELAPVYVADALEKMKSQHGQPPEWLPVPESALRAAADLSDEATRRVRETGRVPGADGDAGKARGYDICWTQINIVRWKGEDWYFRTLAMGGAML